MRLSASYTWVLHVIVAVLLKLTPDVRPLRDDHETSAVVQANRCQFIVERQRTSITLEL